MKVFPHGHMCTMRVPGTCGGQKWTLSSGSGIKDGCELHVGAGN